MSIVEGVRVAIVHYHLRPGGVTRVIQHAASALAQENIQTVVLTGEPPSQRIQQLQNIQVVSGLGYNSSPSGAQELFARVEAAARTALGAPPDIWHFHNHSLGKNVLMPEVVYRLAKLQRRLLLQIHDFAEDGRPGNYKLLLDHLGRGDTAKLGSCLYPQAGHIHYAVLNTRDRSFMASAGVPSAQLHLLPNAVRMQRSAQTASNPPDHDRSRLFLYPTRAIRRKNLGEFLLWSAIAEDDDKFAVTLAPKNPAARPVYDRWVRFAQSLNLPIEFEYGTKSQAPLPVLMSGAYALVTTSVAEGFGLSFLEPWLVKRPLIGRNLPEITEQFESAGVSLSGLYTRLDVPVDWIGRKALSEKVELRLKEYLRTYGRKIRAGDVDRVSSAFIDQDRVDFGRLDEPFQERIIRRAYDSPAERQQLRPNSLGPSRDQRDKVEQNYQAVLRAFSLENYGRRLTQIYRSILESHAGSPGELSAEALLEKFLAPERFSLLRTT